MCSSFTEATGKGIREESQSLEFFCSCLLVKYIVFFFLIISFQSVGEGHLGKPLSPQIFALWFITVVRFQLQSTNENNFMVFMWGDYNMWNYIRQLQHQEGREPLLQISVASKELRMEDQYPLYVLDYFEIMKNVKKEYQGHQVIGNMQHPLVKHRESNTREKEILVTGPV